MKVCKYFKVQELVPKSVYQMFGEKSWQFVSDNIIKIIDFAHDFFDAHYKATDATIDHIEILINNWHVGGQFENRGLRTVDYINSQIAKGIKTAKLSQHVGGSTNAVDMNVIIVFKNGRRLTVKSDEVYDLIVKNQAVFMAAGLTTLENKTMTQGWTHCDCRYTGLDEMYIVNP